MYQKKQNQFLIKSIEEGVRIDGRTFLQSRFIDVQFSFINNGSAKVQIGNTLVMCTVTGEILTPNSYLSREGVVKFNVDLTPMAAGHNIASKTFNQAAHISRVLDSIFRKTRALDTESLCIPKSSKVWSLSIDIRILCNDGNVLDTAFLAALAALLHFGCKNEYEIQHLEALSTITSFTPLSIHHHPVLVTIGHFGNQSFLIDPGKEEEDASGSIISIAVNQFQELCGFKVFGGQVIDSNDIPNLIIMASKEASSRLKILNNALSIYKNQRKLKLKNIYNTYELTNDDNTSPDLVDVDNDSNSEQNKDDFTNFLKTELYDSATKIENLICAKKSKSSSESFYDNETIQVQTEPICKHEVKIEKKSKVESLDIDMKINVSSNEQSLDLMSAINPNKVKKNKRKHNVDSRFK